MFRRRHAGGLQGRLVWTAFILIPALLASLSAFGGRHAGGQQGSPHSCEILWSRTIAATAEQPEFHVKFRGLAPGASWRNPGRESAALRVLLDGRYDQHVFLAAGQTTLEYGFILGPVPPGNHILQLEWQRDWTPGLPQPPELGEVTVVPLRRSDEAAEPVLRAPSIYLRPDTIGRFTDVPLLLYWERDGTPASGKVTYTIILSNEDGGTNTERLMARWGRTTDIEWCYAYARGAEALEETFQGRDHETRHFKGIYDGWHPRLFDASRNNIFSDQPTGPDTVRVRTFPVYQELRGRTRESVMDRNAWIYPLMAGEMIREGKIEDPADPMTGAVSDLRNYAYVDTCAQQDGTELRFECRLRHGTTWFSSDHGDRKSRIDRSGCFRSSIELPRGTEAARLSALKIECLGAPTPEGKEPVSDPRARIESVGPLFLLQESYEPSAPLKLPPFRPRALKPGQSLELAITR